ncbi:speckle-type POZ protein-like [Argiope bruennichi]|uniref:speckle-type POZ protein-like n=1 Tax=Argiope bruennichi TaxID=94029 RepID=UPI002494E763|nr:speckle-type POZ protein-like [Argiope bruennichi]
MFSFSELAYEEICEKNYFSWSINNFSYCWQKTGEALISPSFTLNKTEETRWKLLLFPRGRVHDSSLTLCLQREKICHVVEKAELKYRIYFFTADGALMYASAINDSSDEISVERNVFSREKKDYFSGDILTLRCIFYFAEKSVEIRQQIVRSIIYVENLSFVWFIEKFSRLTTDDIKTFEIKSPANQVMTKINLFHTEAQYSEANLFTSICPIDQSMKYFTVKIFLIDSKKREVDIGAFDCWFDNGKYSTFPCKLKKSDLINHKNRYLPNDILTLRFELIISTGLAVEAVEKVVSDYTSLTTNEVTHSWQNSITQEKIFHNPCSLTSDLMSLYTEQSLCDMKLQTKTNTFPVHTSILGARSPVFKAMFSSEMKEKINGSADVSDLDDETVRRLLLYFYSDKLEDLNWNVAFQLYKAADKYSVISLKEKCSFFMKSNLHLENVCDALILSDLHQDKDLKVTAQQYILKNAKEILKSEEWKLLVDAYSKLAVETMSRNWIDD